MVMTLSEQMVNRLIKDSQDQNMVSSCMFNEDYYHYLLLKCEALNDHKHIIDFWGSNKAGPWRVHMIRDEEDIL